MFGHALARVRSLLSPYAWHQSCKLSSQCCNKVVRRGVGTLIATAIQTGKLRSVIGLEDLWRSLPTLFWRWLSWLWVGVIGG